MTTCRNKPCECQYVQSRLTASDIMIDMRRVQVQFTEAQVEGLERRALESGRSFASVVREAADALLGEDERRRRLERALSAIGGFHSGLGNLAVEHDRYLDEDD